MGHKLFRRAVSAQLDRGGFRPEYCSQDVATYVSILAIVVWAGISLPTPMEILLELPTGKVNQDADHHANQDASAKTVANIIQTAAEKDVKVLLVFLPSVDAIISSGVRSWPQNPCI